MKEFFEIFNFRFFSFIIIATMPLWFGVICCSVVLIQEKLGVFDNEDNFK